MSSRAEQLAEALTDRFAGEGINRSTATFMAEAVARRATFDELGVVHDLPTIVSEVRAENADLLSTFVIKPVETPTRTMEARLDAIRRH